MFFKLKQAVLIALVCILFYIPAAMTQSANQIVNGNFESASTDAWIVPAETQAHVTDQIAFEGTQALRISSTEGNSVIGIDLKNLISPDMPYTLSGQIRMETESWCDFNVFLKEAGERNWYTRTATGKDAWTEFTIPLCLPEKSFTDTLELYLEPVTESAVYYLDLVALRPDLLLEARPSGPNTELSLWLGPKLPNRVAIDVDLNIQSVDGQSIYQQKLPLYTFHDIKLDPGFYKAAMQTVDIDGKNLQTVQYFSIGDSSQLTHDADEKIKSITENELLNAYHGWIKYLAYCAKFAQSRKGFTDADALQKGYRLLNWIERIKENPNLIYQLDDVQEWAYLAKADNSGQPFKIAIPVDYDSSRAYPLVLYMHGYGGNHLEHSTGTRSNPDYFEIPVLGRARGGGYVDLSEADVMDVVAYVEKYWHIDKSRIHATGGSMGGFATFNFTMKHPDMFASARPTCGHGTSLPVENALYVPYYATHSIDDPVVPVLTSRLALRKLRDIGGQVIIDETSGLGHAAWTYTAGNARAQEWMYSQVRPDFKDVRHIQYTALNRKCNGAYWAEVAEWGDLNEPAKMNITYGRGNHLYVTLLNTKILVLDIPNSPILADESLKISVNNAIFDTLKAPIPDTVYLCKSATGWSIQTKIEVPDTILHTPGTVHNLYMGEPLLIVYGTQDSDEMNVALYNAAVAASKSPNVLWVGDGGDIVDGVPNHQLLYGHLNIKADTVVTQNDLDTCYLLIIGSAEQNQLAAKMAFGLPVSLKKNTIECGKDSWNADHIGLGLYYYNPLAPGKAIFWVASSYADFYRPYNFLMQLHRANTIAGDLLVVNGEPIQIIKTRNFNSRWQWMPENTQSPLFNETNAFGPAIESQINQSIIKQTGADFSIFNITLPPDIPIAKPNVTRMDDIVHILQESPMAEMVISGKQLKEYLEAFNLLEQPLRLYPEPNPESIEDETKYRIAMTAEYGTFQTIINTGLPIPDIFYLTDSSLGDILE